MIQICPVPYMIRKLNSKMKRLLRIHLCRAPSRLMNTVHTRASTYVYVNRLSIFTNSLFVLNIVITVILSCEHAIIVTVWFLSRCLLTSPSHILGLCCQLLSTIGVISTILTTGHLHTSNKYTTNTRGSIPAPSCPLTARQIRMPFEAKWTFCQRTRTYTPWTAWLVFQVLDLILIRITRD